MDEFVPILFKVGEHVLEVGIFIIFTHFLFQSFHFEPLPFSVSPTCRFHLLVDSIKGRPEPTILDDFCLANAISKYFSKLRFVTSKIQPELKCLENTL